MDFVLFTAPVISVSFFFFQAEDGIRDTSVTGVQTCALPICPDPRWDTANCMLYTGWNQGGLRILELTDPEYNGCMRRAVNGGGWLAGAGKNRSEERRVGKEWRDRWWKEQ